MATLLIAGSAAEAAILTLTPSATAVNLGDTFTIDITAKDMNLGAFEVTVEFEPARVSLLGEPQFFGLLGGPGLSLQFGATGIDSVELDETSFLSVPELQTLQGSAPCNSFLLGQLQFKAETVGVADFNFVFDYLTDVTGQNQIIADLAGTSVAIGAPQGDEVPEPSTMLLAGAGLAVAASLRRLTAR